MLRRTLAAGLASLVAWPIKGFARKQYDPGASDTEIVLGQTMPYSGPVSASGIAGQACSAYFEAVNKAGGINGRRIRLISLDDGYSPPKTAELTHRLVESDKVLLVYGSVGTPTNAAVQRYLNGRKVPQLFITSGASRFNNPAEFPWTVPVLPSYAAEGRALARLALQRVANARIAVLYQNDDLGKDFVGGFKGGLGARAASLIVSEQTYEVTDPTIDSQVAAAKASGANVFYFAGTPRFGALQIRARHDLGWKPLHLVCSIASGVEPTLKPAGLDRAEGLVSTAFAKDPNDPAWADDHEVRAYLDWANATLARGAAGDLGAIIGYIASALTAHVLQQAGDELTRARILEVASHLDRPPVPMLLPGVGIRTTPGNYGLIDRFVVQEFRDGRWIRPGQTVAID
jgi:ABC-type branched-subunit amino acid transport system substrate-binding protein